MLLGAGQHHHGRRAYEIRLSAEEGRPRKGAGPQREVWSARGSRRTDRGYHRGYAAAHRDPEDALPGQRDPDLRRTHRSADPAGDRRTDGDHAESGSRGQVHSLHLS